MLHDVVTKAIHRMRLAEAGRSKARATSLATAAMLAASGGFLDGFTYIGHGRVFANAMSANVILFGAYLLIRSWQAAFLYLPPLVAFVAAVWAAQAIQLHAKHRRVRTPYGAVLLLEALVLAALSVLPVSVPDPFFTTAVAFGAAVQMQTFREVNGRVYGSTFTTGNLRTLSEAAFTWMFERHDRQAAMVIKDFAIIVAAFLGGAIGGGIATKAFGNGALWWDIALLSVVAICVEMRCDLVASGPTRALARLP